MPVSRRRAAAGLAVPLLLFSSGLCALVYQLIWMREFRLMFGGSTAASAAVLGIFMGGLGTGSLFLSRKVERATNPLMFYGVLELSIALLAASSPFLLKLAGAAYGVSGGTLKWGMIFGTLIRLALAVAVIGVPTFLMGGTLPAAVKALTPRGDLGRRRAAMIYGVNTLGAVTGAVLATFFLVERFGDRRAILLAALLNLIVGLAALLLARIALPVPPTSANRPTVPVLAGASFAQQNPKWLVLPAAGLAGFVFFVMEIVWYRMLAPILGGSTFTFGIILAVALLGIGLGAAAYGLLAPNRPATLGGFALTCTLEALCIGAPFRLGDTIAVMTALLHRLDLLGFGGQILTWTIITAIVVAPAAFIAGIQFPMLISLLGRGKESVGTHAGQAYVWNTGGAILGSLAGGFGIMPLLTAPGTWRLAVLALVVLGLLSALISVRRKPFGVLLPCAIAALAVAAVHTGGPTAAWRHSAIGAGRAGISRAENPNQIEQWIRATRRGIFWEADGIESAVAVSHHDAFDFLVNGKSDGNSRYDAGTQVMCGLVSALLQPHPQQALVVGLGTGSTAGWLAAVPGIERVDVVELEPSILKVAELCAPVNHRALENPKLHVTIGDGREVILQTEERYDIIASEPSNPYRAGVASLFTREFYAAAAARLKPGGHFAQWVQGYEVDQRTIRMIYATMTSVFPSVETWETQPGDLLFIASEKPIEYAADVLRTRITEEPFRSALANVWRVDSLEGVLGRFVGNGRLARSMALSLGAELNTDDQTLLEYAFARLVGKQKDFNPAELKRSSLSEGFARPEYLRGAVDWETVALHREMPHNAGEEMPKGSANPFVGQTGVSATMSRYIGGDFESARTEWHAAKREPVDLDETSVVAEILSDAKDNAALRYIDKLAPTHPGEAEVLRGIFKWREGHTEDAAAIFEKAFVLWRTDPWARPELMRHTLDTAAELARTAKNDALTLRLFEALREPFAIHVLNLRRLLIRINLAENLSDWTKGTRLLQEEIRRFEPNPIWTRQFLKLRADTYAARHDPLKAVASKDFVRFKQNEPLDRPGGR